MGMGYIVRLMGTKYYVWLTINFLWLTATLLLAPEECLESFGTPRPLGGILGMSVRPQCMQSSLVVFTYSLPKLRQFHGLYRESVTTTIFCQQAR